jgi:hypothetical protein
MITEENIQNWEDRIYYKEDFWPWTSFKSWNVTVEPNIKLKEIQIKELDEIDDEDDVSSEII